MRRQTSAFLLIALCAATAPAVQLPYLVKDLNTDAQGAYGSGPFNFVSAGERAYFASQRYETGYSIWTTDGETDGTYRVAAFPDCQPSWNELGPILDSLGDLVFFAQRCFGDDWRQHLWRTDGSALGTFPLAGDLAEIHTGSGYSAQESTLSNTLHGRFYFGARISTESDLELWSTDGTAEGTARVGALPAPPGSWVSYFARAGDRLMIFVHQNTYDHLTDIWSSDGTTAGTRRIASLKLGYSPVAAAGASLLYFTAPDPGDPSQLAYQLWVTDGTNAGTRMLTHFSPEERFEVCSSAPRSVGDELLFCAATLAAGQEIWRSDGTSAGTFPLSAFGNREPFAFYTYTVEATKLAGTYYFLGYGDDNAYALWRSEGTPGAAVGVRTIANPGEYLEVAPWLEQVGGRLVFWGFDDGWKPLTSDGTGAGTLPLADTCADLCPPFVGSAGVVGDRLLFVARDAEQHHQLWSTRGTPQSTFRLSDDIQDIAHGGERELLGAAFGERWLFPARDAWTGFEPWAADPAHTQSAHRVEDLVLDTPGIQIYDRDVLGSELAFSTRTDFRYGDFGVYRSDGTAAGTIEIARTRSCECGLVCGTPPSDVLPAPAGVLFEDPEDCESFSIRSWLRSSGEVVRLFGGPEGPRPGEPSLYPLGEQALVFLHHEGTDTEIWRTDGSEAGTSLALGMTTGVQRRPLVPVGSGLLLLSADSGIGLTYFDPAQGTAVELPSYTSRSYWPHDAAVVGSSAYFLAGAYPLADEIWRSDGTEAGTVHLLTLPAESQVASSFFDLNGRALFAMYNWETGLQLWASDGTAPGTSRLKSFPDVWYELHSVGRIGNRALFSIAVFDYSTGLFRSELWETDGTSAGTRYLGDLRRGEQAAFIDRFLTSDIGLFFESSDGDNGATLWSTDGTHVGTVALWTNPPPAGGNAAGALRSVAMGSDIVFSAETTARGIELGVSDGTPGGTRLLADLRPGVESSVPQDFSLADGRLFFTADDGIHGRELWALTAVGNGICVSTETSLCLLGGRFRLELASARGSALARPLTDSTGGFALSGGTPPDAFFKLIDGSAVNRNHWLFGAGLEAEAFTLRVTDTADGSSRTWTTAAGELASFGDIAAFPYLPPTPSGLEPPDDSALAGGCPPVDDRLCFEEGRYLVSANVIDWNGAASSAFASPLTLGPHEGAFWFFAEAALELVVRLRRDPVTDRVALAVAALTNLGYEVQILDSLTGRVVSATHPAGTFHSFESSDLFPAP